MDFLIQPYVEFMIAHKIPYFAAFLLWYFAEFLLILIFLFLSVFLFAFAERKILTLLSSHKKNTNNPDLRSCLQIISKFIKSFFKEDIVPEKADKFFFTLAPIIIFVSVLFLWLLLPFSMSILPIKSDVGILFFFAVLLISAFGFLLAGFASGNKYSSLFTFRSIALIFSYGLPMMFASLSVVVLSGSMSFLDIVTEQYRFGLFSWYVFPSFLGFLVFFISSLAAMNRIPFDFKNEMCELGSDFSSGYSGMKHALLSLANYAVVFIICAFTVIMFFGGYMPPLPFSLANLFENSDVLYGLILTCEQIFWLFLKIFLLLFLVIWIRATLPRFKSEKFIELCWKYLLPISVINLLFVFVIKLGGLYVF